MLMVDFENLKKNFEFLKFFFSWNFSCFSCIPPFAEIYNPERLKERNER